MSWRECPECSSKRSPESRRAQRRAELEKALSAYEKSCTDESWPVGYYARIEHVNNAHDALERLLAAIAVEAKKGE